MRAELVLIQVLLSVCLVFPFQFTRNHHQHISLSRLSSSPDDNSVSAALINPIVPSSGAGSAFGSDMLARPDDESSPEFREYLKQLLKMQANRARAGHASPSSASADAYMAKLTRLKIEQNLRREAGLPEISKQDRSYRQEDYQSAVSEGADPAVAGEGVQLAAPEMGIKKSTGTGKLRGLTAEELRLKAAAEESVSKMLITAQADAQFKPSTGPVKPKATLKKVDDNSEEGRLMKGFFSSPPSKRPSVGPAVPATSTSYADKQQKAVAKKSNAPPPPPPEAPTAVSQRNKAAASAAAAPEGGFKVRKLDPEELTVVGKALQMTVKHWGGGPFG
jgi:hypothetical protein